jgi:nicotinic acid phosphoribosyltransferase
MNLITTLYNDPLALLTDFYQITSAYAFWKKGLHETKTVYHMFHRSPRSTVGTRWRRACSISRTGFETSTSRRPI